MRPEPTRCCRIESLARREGWHTRSPTVIRRKGRRMGEEPTRRKGARPRRTREPRLQQAPWATLENTFPPVEPLSTDQIEAIHDTSMRILEDSGIEVMHKRSCDLFAAAGADVDHGIGVVRIDRALLEETIAKAPSRFSLAAGNPTAPSISAARPCFSGLWPDRPMSATRSGADARPPWRTTRTSFGWRSISTSST
jgi:hypothetical protein